MKEAKPDFYMKHILPILHKNKVIHFVGFSNRLAFDPMPFDLQVRHFSFNHFITSFDLNFFWLEVEASV